MSSHSIQSDLQSLANSQKAAFFPSFFKTGPGQYGEGDVFIGVTVPQQREVAKKYANLPLPEIKNLLDSPIHEHRLTALLILVLQYQKTKDKKIVDFYLANTTRINNWDLVDTSADKILGTYLLDKDRQLLYTLVKSPLLWERRIAIIATFAFIKQKDFTDTIKLSQLLLADKHDLMHKAVGWMLREMGKRDETTLCHFLDQHVKKMPRTALRYAIERLDEKKRKQYLQK
ncbi:DNA alkylation repair protein [Candidatus Woesearchaeota archaeon]|nr:DNA alkylation repair protein [Candidatus Woesearchaeota archaeon]